VDATRLGRNLLFSIVILAAVVAMSKAELPTTQRAEEYIAFVLSTEFDFAGWLAENGGDGLLARLAGWTDRFARLEGGGREPAASPAAAGASR